MKHLQILIIALGLISLSTSAMATEKSVSSPDGQLIVTISDQGGTPTYHIDFCGCEVLMPSALGMQTSLGDLTKGLTIVNATTKSVADDYQLDRIKTSSVSYRANQLDVTFQRTDSIKFIVRFQVSNNDVAFRYEIPRPKANNPKRMTIFKEATAFRLPTGSTTFLCPQIGPETGWGNTKPSYEEDYEANMPMGKASKFGLGYTFPCLFSLAGANTVTEKGWNEAWMLIGETGVSSAYCGSHLSDFTNGQYSIAFPHRGENNGFGSEYAVVPLPGKTPWRTITVGQTLKPIVETTVAYDVVEPQYEAPKYKPGRYTWSWLIWQDASINYDDQVKFIDLASAMGFEYCLVDTGGTRKSDATASKS